MIKRFTEYYLCLSSCHGLQKDDFRIDNQVFKPVLHQSECSSFLSMPSDNEDLSLPSFPITLKNVQRGSQNQTQLADARSMQRPTPRYVHRGPDNVETCLRPRLNIYSSLQPSFLTLGNELFSAFEQISCDNEESKKRGCDKINTCDTFTGRDAVVTRSFEI